MLSLSPEYSSQGLPDLPNNTWRNGTTFLQKGLLSAPSAFPGCGSVSPEDPEVVLPTHLDET